MNNPGSECGDCLDHFVKGRGVLRRVRKNGFVRNKGREPAVCDHDWNDAIR